ncbi:MAG: tetratricopeptide repeat protein [Pseudomonadota bacterium]
MAKKKKTQAEGRELGKLLADGQLERALACANTLLDAREGLPQALQAHLTHARVALARGDTEVAERALLEARMLAPDDVELQTLLAHQALDEERPEKAVHHLQRIRAVTGRDLGSSARLALARLASGSGLPELAVKALQDAVERAPEDRNLSVLLATALLNAGRADQAMSLLQQHCARFPDDSTAWQMGGRLLAAHAEASTCLLWCREAVAACPDERSLHVQLLSAAAAGQQYGAARTSVELLRRQAATEPELHAPLAIFYLATGKHDLALASVAALQAALPDHADLRRIQAATLLQKARSKVRGSRAQVLVEQARTLLEEQLQRSPEDAAAAVDLSAILLQGDVRDRERAQALLDRTLLRQPTLASALSNRAALHAISGEAGKASVLARRALEHARAGTPAALQARRILDAGDPSQAGAGVTNPR